MFRVDEHYVESSGRIRGIRDDHRGLALRLQQTDMRGEGDEFRLWRRGREYVLFVTVAHSRTDKSELTFHIEHGNLADDTSGLLSTLSRQMMLADVVDSFRAYGTLILLHEPNHIQVLVRSASESSATYKDLLTALVTLRKRHPALLEELYATFEAGRSLSNNQFSMLLNTVRSFNLRSRTAAYRAASDVLPHVIYALRGPFGRRAPNLVRQAIRRAVFAFIAMLVLLVWAVPSTWQFVARVAAGQVGGQTQLDLLVDLFGGAFSIALIGTTFYTIAIMVRLSRRERVFNYIRTGRGSGAA
jgi:hypothetical protein